MTKEHIYDQLKTVLSLAWKNEDRMTQDTLFRLQEHLANLTLAVAEDIGESALKDLCKAFPYLYNMR